MPEVPGMEPVDPASSVESVDPAAQPVQDDGVDLSRYTIHVPARDQQQRSRPEVLAQLRQALTNAGLQGRIVIPSAQGDWEGNDMGYTTDELALVIIDADSSPDTLQTIKDAAQGVKQAVGQKQVYLTVEPVKAYLI